MFKDFKIDNSIDVPIYRQLTDMVRSKIAAGEILPGTKMPTVRELSKDLGVAQGTIKRAYDELELMGVVEKAQGKGTFISDGKKELPPSESRKDRAMEAIDNMFDELESMGFSGTEIGIFLELKQREREARGEKLKVALVECNPETLYMVVEQIRSPELDIYPFILDDVRSYPYKLSQDLDLVITTTSHFDEVAELVPQKDKLLGIALSLTTGSVHDLLMIPPKSKLGILSVSQKFGEMILKEIHKYSLKVESETCEYFDELKDSLGWVKGKDYILLPEGYEKYATGQVGEALAESKKKGKILLCSYGMDKGSLFQLNERLKSIKN